jgi:hypothetical protein
LIYIFHFLSPWRGGVCATIRRKPTWHEMAEGKGKRGGFDIPVEFEAGGA